MCLLGPDFSTFIPKYALPAVIAASLSFRDRPLFPDVHQTVNSRNYINSNAVVLKALTVYILQKQSYTLP